ncbi:MAG: hypothetical protein ABSA44_08840 [Bacteroidota bacterium]|jgi:hypothetical protein
MNKRFLYSFILGMIAVGIMHSQENQKTATVDSNLCHGSYQLWFDGGIFPRFDEYTGAFEPVYNFRLGVGKQFSIFHIYGFLELTNYLFESNDAMSLRVSSDKRYDIALYELGSIWQILYVGMGAHYTRQDNIVIQYLHGISNNATAGTGPHTYFGFYYIIGLGYPINISNTVSLPIGLYYRRTRDYDFAYFYNYDKTSLALQIGIIYNIGE